MLTFTAVLTVVNLLSSFAAVSSISSPLPEPEVYNRSTGSGYEAQFYYVFHTTVTNDRQSAEYTLNVVTYSGSQSVDFAFYSYGRLLSFPVASKPVTFTYSQFNALTGDFLYQYEYSFSYTFDINGVTWYRSFANAYYPNFSGTSDWNVYAVISPSTNYLYNYRVTEPFVSFSQMPSEHNTYHSELSEPVADEYNSYFICNDRLYWLSYRANGLYSFTQNFELSSQLYQEDVLYSSSGQGTYAGQANGFSVEPVSISDGSFAGVGTGGTPVVGVYSGFNLGQISYVGVNTGNLRVNSNGQMTYNDLEVYPVSVNSQILNRLFDIVVYLTDDTGFKIWLVPRSDLGQNLVLDASLYCSCFDLTNGDYISSSFSSYTGNYQYAGFDYPLDDKIASVRCYGCAFYNVNNVPVNLSDVFWGYDLEFKEWRDNMLQKLTQIYNLLNNSDSIPETTTSSFGSSVEGLSDPSYSEVSPEQVGNELNNVWDQNPDIVNNSGFVKGWISDFSIPKIIALCILALASGTVILTLGKNKADT